MPTMRYRPEEAARLADEWYEREIRAKLQPGDEGKVLIIDVDTGEYEMGDDSLEITHRMLARKPDAQLFGMRIGYPALGKIGGGWNRSRR